MTSNINTNSNIPDKQNTAGLDYYALGKRPNNNNNIPVLKYNRSFKDTSNDLLHRNKLSLNSENFNGLRETAKNLYSLTSSNINNNNYLEPLKVFKNKEGYNIEKNYQNKEMYRLTKDKFYAK